MKASKHSNQFLYKMVDFHEILCTEFMWLEVSLIRHFKRPFSTVSVGMNAALSMHKSFLKPNYSGTKYISKHIMA
jgi:hypothetical protein